MRKGRSGLLLPSRWEGVEGPPCLLPSLVCWTWGLRWAWALCPGNNPGTGQEGQFPAIPCIPPYGTFPYRPRVCNSVILSFALGFHC